MALPLPSSLGHRIVLIYYLTGEGGMDSEPPIWSFPRGALYFIEKGLNIRVIPTTKCNHSNCVHSGTVNQTLARTPFVRLHG